MKPVRVLMGVSASLTLLIVALPFQWWYTSFGNMIQVKDSPFFVDMSFSGYDLSFSLLLPINIFLISLRIAELYVSAMYLVFILFPSRFPGEAKISMFPFYAMVFYLVDLLLFSVVTYVATDKLILALGAFTESFSSNTPPIRALLSLLGLNSAFSVEAEIYNYPLPMFYLVTAIGIFTIIVRLLYSDEIKRTK